ncbi:ankyrin repeat domain-containing protein [Cellulomonas sp. 179-A 4D5 NHS]|uniref:ankyrin repeat domain-containing protein n=1 Tax=Cellulomonas sp. 179-A 4D5 NHS TaxID=3142378 RepID=UPI00399F6B7B
MTPAHLAVENDDLPMLRDLLDGGADIDEVDGLTLLQHAIDAEVQGYVQLGEPLHVDMTAYLLARGADPLATVPGTGSALDLARRLGHWLAVTVIEAHLDRRR